MEKAGDFVVGPNALVKLSAIAGVVAAKSTTPDDAGERHSDLLLQAGEEGGEVIDFDDPAGRRPGKNSENHASAVVARSPLAPVGYEKECGASHQELQVVVDRL